VTIPFLDQTGKKAHCCELVIAYRFAHSLPKAFFDGVTFS